MSALLAILFINCIFMSLADLRRIVHGLDRFGVLVRQNLILKRNSRLFAQSFIRLLPDDANAFCFRKEIKVYFWGFSGEGSYAVFDCINMIAFFSLAVVFSFPNISMTSNMPGLTVPPVKATRTGWGS